MPNSKYILRLLAAYYLLTLSFLYSTDPAHPLFSTANWGALVIDAETDQTIYEHRSENLFIPASVTKLFTTASALETLGPEYTFTTQVKASCGPNEQGIIDGNLYLEGGADPLLKSKDLIALAKCVHEAGVRIISGRVILDDSLLNGTSLPIHGEWEDLPAYYSAEQNALSVNSNIVQLTINSNGPVNALAKITVNEEIPFFHLINKLRIVSESEKTSYTITRGLSDNIIEVCGYIAASNNPTFDTVAVHNPQEYAKSIFINALIHEGITIQNNFYTTSNPSIKLAHVTSTPLIAIVKNINKISDNLAADLIYKYINLRSDDAVRPLDKLMKALTFIPQQYSINDGSGLSRHNLISPRQTVSLLKFLKNAAYCELFFDTLPTVSEYGTLEHRFLSLPGGTLISAKTGSMSGTSALAGYASTENRHYIFAIFINNSLYSPPETANALDAFLLKMIDK